MASVSAHHPLLSNSKDTKLSRLPELFCPEDVTIGLLTNQTAGCVTAAHINAVNSTLILQMHLKVMIDVSHWREIILLLN